MPYLFKSALDVGSHFIDIIPDNELVFINHQNSLYTQMTIKNVTDKAHVAYFVSLNMSKLVLIKFKIGFYISSLPYQNISKVRFYTTWLLAGCKYWLGR